MRSCRRKDKKDRRSHEILSDERARRHFYFITTDPYSGQGSSTVHVASHSDTRFNICGSVPPNVLL